jgi:hypothetical protein
LLVALSKASQYDHLVEEGDPILAIRPGSAATR